MDGSYFFNHCKISLITIAIITVIITTITMIDDVIFFNNIWYYKNILFLYI